MIRLKDIIQEIHKPKLFMVEVASPDIVVGIIDNDLNVISSNNIHTHGDLTRKYPQWRIKHFYDLTYWRYNNQTKTIYWYQARTEEQEHVVQEELEKRYRFNVKSNVYIGVRSTDVYTQLQNKAHGLNETVLV